MKKAARGTGTVRKKKVVRNGKTYEYWEARVTLGRDPITKKQIQRSFSGKSQKEVLQRMREVQHDIDIGSYKEPNKLTVEMWIDMWIEQSIKLQTKKSTHYSYKTISETHIIPVLGQLKLSELNVNVIQVFCNRLTTEKELAPKTVKNVMSVLHKSLEEAVDYGYLSSNPADKIKLPKNPRKEMKPLTDENVIALLKELDKDIYSEIVKVALFTGMREGEICGLSWDAVDFANGTITVKQQLQKEKEKGGSYYIDTPKNGRYRTMAVSPYVMDVLRFRRSKQCAEKMRAQKYEIWNNKWDLVFTNADGSHIIPQTVLKHFKRIAEKIDRPDARFHDLRHTYAVISLQEGGDIKTLQKNLGHSSVGFTLDKYGHVSEKMERESAAKIESYIRDVTKKSKELSEESV